MPGQWLNRRTITTRMVRGVIGLAYLGLEDGGVLDVDNPFTGLCQRHRGPFLDKLTAGASMIDLGDPDRIWYIARGLLRLPEATDEQQKCCALAFLRSAMLDEGLLLDVSPTSTAFAEMGLLLLMTHATVTLEDSVEI